jgi:antitoxin MazE
MKVKVAKWGNSLGVRLPKAAADAVGLRAGAELEVVVEGSDLRLRKAIRIPFYRLEDMVAQMKPENQPELVDWGPDRGAEILPEDEYSRGEITFDDLVNPKTASTTASGGRKNSDVTPKRRRHRLG